MRYWPLPSVDAERTFSMRTGLAASTVTPGSTAPEVSFTVPVIDPWAYADAGIIASHTRTNRVLLHGFIRSPSAFTGRQYSSGTDDRRCSGTYDRGCFGTDDRGCLGTHDRGCLGTHDRGCFGTHDRRCSSTDA